MKVALRQHSSSRKEEVVVILVRAVVMAEVNELLVVFSQITIRTTTDKINDDKKWVAFRTTKSSQVGRRNATMI